MVGGPKSRKGYLGLWSLSLLVVDHWGYAKHRSVLEEGGRRGGQVERYRSRMAAATNSTHASMQITILPLCLIASPSKKKNPNRLIND